VQLSLLRSESLSSKCAKLQIVATIEITLQDHSIIACLHHIYCIWVLFFTHIPLMVNRTFNTTPMEKLQQHPLLFKTNRIDRMFFL